MSCKDGHGKERDYLKKSESEKLKVKVKSESTCSQVKIETEMGSVVKRGMKPSIP